MAGVIAAVVFVIVAGGLATLAILANGHALSEKEAIRAELDQLRSDHEALGDDPTPEQLAPLFARMDELNARFREFQKSPFVITRDA